MLTLIIALLMSLGIIDAPADYHNATETEKQKMRDIVIEDYASKLIFTCPKNQKLSYDIISAFLTFVSTETKQANPHRESGKYYTIKSVLTGR